MRLEVYVFALALSGGCQGVELKALPEFSRPDPFGGIVKVDSQGAKWLDKITLTAARGGYASYHLAVKTNPNTDYQLALEFPLVTELYREWFHFNTPDRQYYPDALIPIQLPYRSKLPEPDNRVPAQTAQAFWIDFWLPASVTPNTYRGRAILSSGGQQSVVPIELKVLEKVVPEQDAVALDNNSYGTSWMFDQYPKTLAGSSDDALFRLIHAHHRIFYEHRGVFHQLGYGHAGKVGPEFAPELSGVGKHKHVSSWDRFDRHYGPLLDGTAFAGGHRPPRPIPFMYLPINPEWPASFLWWGEPGYEAEFVNVLSDMERHFREKGWTHTNFEVFFNHKKRYKGFNWDGDEVRFERDNRYFVEYHRMLEKAIPAGSPVHFVMRADTSWSMAQQFRELKGIVKFWVAGEGEFSWLPGEAAQLKQRGDIIWTYGGTPPLQQVSSEITLHPLRSWIFGVDGFVRWLTVSPGPDPWFKLGGGDLTLIYPGERFGVAGPLASIRLKLQRNCLQDLALLEAAAGSLGRERVQEETVKRFNGTSLSDWQNVRPAIAAKPVIELNNTDLEDAMKPFTARFANLDPGAWLRVRELVQQ